MPYIPAKRRAKRAWAGCVSEKQSNGTVCVLEGSACVHVSPQWNMQWRKKRVFSFFRTPNVAHDVALKDKHERRHPSPWWNFMRKAAVLGLLQKAWFVQICNENARSHFRILIHTTHSHDHIRAWLYWQRNMFVFCVCIGGITKLFVYATFGRLLFTL